jgi:hypothetical protein
MAGGIGRDISDVVWLGCLALLFLAVAVHEGWFAGNAAPIITSGSVNPSGTLNQGTGTYDGGVYYDPDYGPLPNYGA